MTGVMKILKDSEIVHDPMVSYSYQMYNYSAVTEKPTLHAENGVLKHMVLLDKDCSVMLKIRKI